MTLWKQEGSTSKYRIDDVNSRQRQLEIRPAVGRFSVVVDAVSACDDCHDSDDASLCVSMLDLLVALQGAGVTAEMAIGVWGIGARVDGDDLQLTWPGDYQTLADQAKHPTPIVDRPRAVRDTPQA